MTEAWDVHGDESQWTLLWTDARGNRDAFSIGKNIPWTVAVDAALDFMDRCRRGALRTFRSESDLMSACVRRSLRA